MRREPRVLGRDVADAVAMIRFLGRVPTPGRVVRMVRSMRTEVRVASHERPDPSDVTPLWNVVDIATRSRQRPDVPSAATTGGSAV